MFVTERKAAMGKLAEIKDMEEAVEQENNEAKEFIRFTKRQEEHNQLMEKLMKITAGCAAGVLAVAVIAAIVIVPKSASVLSEAKKITAQTEEWMPQVQETVDQAQQVIAQINEGNPKELMNNVNDLTKEGQTAMQESVEELKKAVEILEKIDINALNEAVDNLGKAVSPLARLFGGR